MPWKANAERTRLLERIDIIKFAPFDILVYVRIALVLLGWRHASEDYTGLAVLGDHTPLFHHALGFIDALSIYLIRNALTGEYVIVSLQILGVLACAFAAWRPSRMSIIAAFIAVSLIEYPAYLWRYQNWDNDLPMAVLILIAVFPVRLFEVLTPSREVSRQATAVGGTLAAYMAGMYFAAGLSKIMLTWRWPFEVDLGNNWRTQLLDVSEYSHIIAPLAKLASWAFITFPWLAATIAVIVLVEQLQMPLALVSRKVRFSAPLVLFLNHVGVALSLGIMFSSMPILGPGIFVPWRRLFQSKPEEIKAQQRLVSRRMVAGVIASAALIAAPILNGLAYEPFANNLQFGWLYRAPADYHEVYSVGYYDTAAGKYLPYQNGRGGFFDHRFTSLMNVRATLIATDAASFPQHGPDIEAMLCAARPAGSDRLLLGWFALPEHRWLQNEIMTMAPHAPFYILRGRPLAADLADKYRPVRVAWEPVLSLGTPKCH